MSGSLRKFYRNKNILLTGGTGFLGLGILEKILRTFPDVGNVYVIAREKRGDSISARRNKLMENLVFNRLKEEHLKNGSRIDFTKLHWIHGDLNDPGLGLSHDIVKELQKEVNIIIHSAATVKFVEPLKDAITINVTSTQDLLNLATGCKHFEGFLYVSTSYSQARKSVKDVSETIMQHPIEPRDLINHAHTMTMEQLNAKTSEIIGDWPNTYSYSKNAAENLIETYYKHLFPICIYRPGIVIHSYHEPTPYWIGNNMAFARIMMEGHRGYVLDTISRNVNSNLVPVDLVVNGLLAALQYTVEKKKFEVFNYTTSHNPWEFTKVFNTYVSKIENYKSELIPLRQKLMGMLKMNKAPLELGKTQKKILVEIQAFEDFLETCKYFLNTHFNFENNHMNMLWDGMSDENKALCPFDLRHIDWEEFYKNAYHNSHGTNKIDFSALLHA